MILSRISKAVREQNWFAVAIEFVIVIAGVVIGFQITAWNADTQDRQTARFLMQRLQSDFEHLSEDLERRAEAARASSGAMDQLYQDTITGWAEDEIQTLRERLEPVAYTPPASNSPTLQRLISTGDIDLMRCDALIDSLNQFNERLAQQWESYRIDTSYRYSEGSLVFALLPPENLANNPGDAAYLIEIATSPEFRADIRTLQLTMQSQVSQHEGTLRQAQAVAEALESCAP